jgi:hypothetical protein
VRPKLTAASLVGFGWAVDLKVSATCIEAQSSFGAAEIRALGSDSPKGTNRTRVDRGQKESRELRAECAYPMPDLAFMLELGKHLSSLRDDRI